MGLHNYAAASSGAAQELASSLASAEIVALAEDLKALGHRPWLRWQSENEGEIQDYVSATPLSRERKKKWREPALRRRLVLAAMLHCQAAHALLRFLADHECALSPGGSYRDTTALAGTLFWQLWGIEIQEWPEEFELHCPSPFE